MLNVFYKFTHFADRTCRSTLPPPRPNPRRTSSSSHKGRKTSEWPRSVRSKSLDDQGQYAQDLWMTRVSTLKISGWQRSSRSGSWDDQGQKDQVLGWPSSVRSGSQDGQGKKSQEFWWPMSVRSEWSEYQDDQGPYDQDLRMTKGRKTRISQDGQGQKDQDLSGWSRAERPGSLRMNKGRKTRISQDGQGR